MQRIKVSAGQPLVEAGAPPGPFFIIEQGSCGAWLNGQQLALMGPGDNFGEVSLLLTDKAPPPPPSHAQPSFGKGKEASPFLSKWEEEGGLTHPFCDSFR
jgi:hypothetical protein